MTKLVIDSRFLFILFSEISKQFAPNAKYIKVGIDVVVLAHKNNVADIKISSYGVEVCGMANLTENTVFLIPLESVRVWKKLLENLPIQPVNIYISDRKLKIEAVLPVFNF